MATTLATLAEGKTTIRWKEPYVSDGLNRKLFGAVPCGVVRGGHLTTSVSALTVEISPDSEHGDSIYLACTDDGRHLTVREEGIVSLSLNIGAVPGSVVYIGLKVDYTTGADTVATWGAYSEGDISVDETIVVVGRVDVPGSGVIPAADVTSDGRRSAWLDRAPEMRDGIQLARSGSVDVPTPLADILPFWNIDSTGSVVVVHSNVDNRSKTHSFAVSGDNGTSSIGLHSGDLQTLPLYSISEGQHIRFTLYRKADSVTADITVFFWVNYYDEPIDGGFYSSDSRETLAITGTDSDWVKFEGELVSPIDGWFNYSILVSVDPGNTGSLFIDDIRVWMGAEDPESDTGQSRLMGINREITGSSLALLPAALPDNLIYWATGIVRLINITDPSGSPTRIRMTMEPADAVGTAQKFEFWMEALLTVYGKTIIEDSEATALLEVNNSGAGVGIEVTADNSYGIRAFGNSNAGVYAESTPGSVSSDMVSGVVGVMDVRALNNKVSSGMLGVGKGSAGTYRVGIGVIGVALHDQPNPNIFSEFNCGVFGYGDRSYGWSPVWPPEGTGVGGVFHGADLEGNQPGLSGIEEVSGSGIFARGGLSYGYGGAGGYFIGGRRSSTPQHASPGVRAYGGNSGAGVGYHGGVGGVFVAGERSDATAEHGVGIYAQYNYPENEGHGARLMGRDDGFFGACIGNDLANSTIEALAVNAGIVFRQKSGVAASQHPASTTGLKNTLKALGVPKAWARIECTTTTPTIHDGMNIASAEYSPDVATLRVYLAEDLQDANGCVICTSMVSSGYLYFQGNLIAAGEFRLRAYDGSGTLIASLDGTNYDVCVVVFGRQALDDFPDFNNTI